jgi:hypothetical protein
MTEMWGFSTPTIRVAIFTIKIQMRVPVIFRSYVSLNHLVRTEASIRGLGVQKNHRFYSSERLVLS